MTNAVKVQFKRLKFKKNQETGETKVSTWYYPKELRQHKTAYLKHK